MVFLPGWRSFCICVHGLRHPIRTLTLRTIHQPLVSRLNDGTGHQWRTVVGIVILFSKMSNNTEITHITTLRQSFELHDVSKVEVEVMLLRRKGFDCIKNSERLIFLINNIEQNQQQQQRKQRQGQRQQHREWQQHQQWSYQVDEEADAALAIDRGPGWANGGLRGRGSVELIFLIPKRTFGLKILRVILEVTI